MNTRFSLALFLASAQVAAFAAERPDTLPQQTLNPVVVTGTRNAVDARHLPLTVSVLGRQELTKQFRTSVLPSVVEQVPGLFVTSRGVLGYGVSTGAAGGIKVRGVGSGAQMLVLVDGQPQYAGLMGHPIADAIQTLTTERVEVLRGPASVLYGSNAMGGVMNLVSRRLPEHGQHTEVQLEGGSYGTFQGQASNQVRAGRFSSTLGVSYARTDGHRINNLFEQYSGYVKLGYDFSTRWRATADLSLLHFNASNPGEESNPYIDNDSHITRGLASLQVANDYGRASGAVRLFYDWGHHRIDDGYHPGGTPQTSLYLHDDLMAGITAYESVNLFAGNRTTLGIDYQHFGGKAWNRAKADGERSMLADKTQNEVAGYVDFRQTLAPWLTLDAGLRVDHHSQVGTELVPQGSLLFTLSSSSSVRAMVSKGFRNPTIRELYMFRPANDGLQPERMMNYELAYSQSLLDGRLHFGANVFYLRATNLISTERRDGKPINVNTGRTENAGVELEGHYRVNNNLALNANYSYLHTDNPTTGAPTHKLFAGADWAVGRFALNTSLQYVAGLYLATGDDAEKENFVLWNATLAYRLLKQARIYVRGENLLARKYYTMQGFPMPRTTVMAGLKFDF